MICKNCNQQLEEGAMFCSNCGSAIEEQVAETNVTIEETNVEISEETPDTEVNTTEVEDTLILDNNVDIPTEVVKTKKKALPIILLAAVIITLISAIAVLGKDYLFGSKEDKLVEAYKKTFQDAKQMEYSNVVYFDELELASDEFGADQEAVDLVTKLIKDIKFISNIKVDAEKNKMQFSLDINIRDAGFIDAIVYIDNEKVAVSIPKLYDKQFYCTWNELAKFAAGEEFDVSKYIDYVLAFSKEKDVKEFNYDEYANKMLEYMKYTVSKNEKATLAGEEVKADAYLIDIDYEKVNELLVDLILIATKDEQVYKLVDKFTNGLADLVVESGDADLFYMDESSIEELRNASNMLKEYANEANIEAFKDEILNNQLNVEMPYNTTAEYKVFIKGDSIKGYSQKASIDFNDSSLGLDMKMSVVSEMLVKSINKQLDFITVTDDNSINVLNMSDDQMYDIMMEVQQKALPLVMSNPAIAEIIGQLMYR